MTGPVVTSLGDELWRVEWSEGDRVIDNVFTYPKVPKVKVTTGEKASTILLTQDGVEVGRYNVEWAGTEVPCDDVNDLLAGDD